MSAIERIAYAIMPDIQEAWMKDRQKENDTACGFASTVSLDDGISQNAISILAQKERENENSSKS